MGSFTSTITKGSAKVQIQKPKVAMSRRKAWAIVVVVAAVLILLVVASMLGAQQRVADCRKTNPSYTDEAGHTRYDNPSCHY